MPKIPGLRKKRKNKKNKHKEEEFDAEELANYRREHQVTEEGAAAGEASAEGKGDEWQKFKALTAGVDSILKKTHDDLAHLKETSYFQRKPPGPSSYGAESAQGLNKDQTWTEFEEGTEKAELDEATGEERVLPKLEELPLRFQEYDGDDDEEDDSDVDEDIFDTTYLDLVPTDDLQLVYISDSPIEKVDGPDPFDTSIVDKVLPKEKERKHKLISLGCAVDVLAKKADKTAIPEHHDSRRRQKSVDLLLVSFDEDSKTAAALNQAVTPLDEPVKTLLDEGDLELSNSPVDIVDTLSILQKINETVQAAQLPKAPEKTTTPILEKFGIDELIDGEDDEFAALATESLAKSPLKSRKDFQGIKPERPPLPSTLGDQDSFDDIRDPFDTSFTENVLPGKCELKLIENEILKKDESELIQSERVKFDGKTIKYSGITIEINNHTKEEKEVKKDLLGGSTNDLSHIDFLPINPTAKESSEEIEFSSEDPFDTSIVHSLIAPGKVELKYLEQDLLPDNKINDLKTEEITAHRPDLLIGTKKYSIPKVVAFIEPPGINNVEENSKKPVTPYYPGRSFESENLDLLSEDLRVEAPKDTEGELDDLDLFDTSITSTIEPLTTVESKLMSTDNIEVSDPFEITDLK